MIEQAARLDGRDSARRTIWTCLCAVASIADGDCIAIESHRRIPSRPRHRPCALARSDEHGPDTPPPGPTFPLGLKYHLPRRPHLLIFRDSSFSSLRTLSQPCLTTPPSSCAKLRMSSTRTGPFLSVCIPHLL